MTPNVLCDLPRHQRQPDDSSRHGFVERLLIIGWCCSRPSGRSFWALQLKSPIRIIKDFHLRPTVFAGIEIGAAQKSLMPWSWCRFLVEAARCAGALSSISWNEQRGNLNAIFLLYLLWSSSLLLVAISKQLELQDPGYTRSHHNSM